MKVFIAGIDGYLGWPLAQYLAARGHCVAGIDRFLRRKWVDELGSQSAIPIPSIEDRQTSFLKHYGRSFLFQYGDIQDFEFVRSCLDDFKPDAIVHLAEMPSAPFSMLDQPHSILTQQNNVIGSLSLLWAIREVCPDCHLVKLGTMGEYGTPNIDIPEGFFEIEFRGRKDKLPFPRQANSFYHLSKVHDSHNTMFACKVWGLSATDIMQGVVYGTQIDEMDNDPSLATRLDFDQCFGTAINRFCAQAVIGHPLTVFGDGSQTRGFLPLRDSMQCIELIMNNPPNKGEYRVVNQFDRTYSIADLAVATKLVCDDLGFEIQINHYDNPRKEQNQHYYKPDRNILTDLGYRPRSSLTTELQQIIGDLTPHGIRILEKQHLLVPDIRWDGYHRTSHILNK